MECNNSSLIFSLKKKGCPAYKGWQVSVLLKWTWLHLWKPLQHSMFILYISYDPYLWLLWFIIYSLDWPLVSPVGPIFTVWTDRWSLLQVPCRGLTESCFMMVRSGTCYCCDLYDCARWADYSDLIEMHHEENGHYLSTPDYGQIMNVTSESTLILYHLWLNLNQRCLNPLMLPISESFSVTY